MNARTILTKIADIIAPYVGRLMAHSSIELHCKRLGIAGESMERTQLDALLKQLSLGLVIFIGRDKTDAVMREIRSGVESYT